MTGFKPPRFALGEHVYLVDGMSRAVRRVVRFVIVGIVPGPNVVRYEVVLAGRPRDKPALVDERKLSYEPECKLMSPATRRRWLQRTTRIRKSRR